MFDFFKKRAAPADAGSKPKFHKVLRLALLVGCILLLAVCFAANPDISAQALTSRAPKNPAAAAAAIVALYIFKSITLFFPIIILEIAAGYLFSPWAALVINFIGMLITLIVPYWIGRAAGMDAIQKQIEKHPKFGEILDKQQDNSFFLCFFLRVVTCVPGDIITMYLGATKTPFWKNLVAGVLGVLPGMVLATLMGESVQNPRSPMFWLSAGFMIVFAALSVLVYFLYRRRIQRKGRSPE